MIEDNNIYLDDVQNNKNQIKKTKIIWNYYFDN